jgi:hypothetical protein
VPGMMAVASSGSNSKSTRAQRPPGPSDAARGMLSWIWRYFENAAEQGRTAAVSSSGRAVYTTAPPLYLQYQGHSTTVIGIQRCAAHAIKGASGAAAPVPPMAALRIDSIFNRMASGATRGAGNDAELLGERGVDGEILLGDEGMDQGGPPAVARDCQLCTHETELTGTSDAGEGRLLGGGELEALHLRGAALEASVEVLQVDQKGIHLSRCCPEGSGQRPQTCRRGRCVDERPEGPKVRASALDGLEGLGGTECRLLVGSDSINCPQNNSHGSGNCCHQVLQPCPSSAAASFDSPAVVRESATSRAGDALGSRTAALWASLMGVPRAIGAANAHACSSNSCSSGTSSVPFVLEQPTPKSQSAASPQIHALQASTEPCPNGAVPLLSGSVPTAEELCCIVDVTPLRSTQPAAGAGVAANTVQAAEVQDRDDASAPRSRGGAVTRKASDATSKLKASRPKRSTSGAPTRQKKPTAAAAAAAACPPELATVPLDDGSWHYELIVLEPQVPPDKLAAVLASGRDKGGLWQKLCKRGPEALRMPTYQIMVVRGILPAAAREASKKLTSSKLIVPGALPATEPVQTT